MPFAIEFADAVVDELAAIRMYDRARIMGAIVNQLQFEPMVTTKDRKMLSGIQPLFEHEPPVWELRVGTVPCIL